MMLDTSDKGFNNWEYEAKMCGKKWMQKRFKSWNKPWLK